MEHSEARRGFQAGASAITSRVAPTRAPADQRLSWQGFGDGLTQAMEMALTPVLFALLGLLVDGWLGTRPIATITLAVLAMVGVFLKAYYHYVARMDAIEAEKAWRKGIR